MRRPLLFLASISLLTACSPQSLQDLGHHFTVAGVVTDGTTAVNGTGTNTGNTATSQNTGNPLAGVTVSLIPSDHFAPITTGADGSYVFSNVLQGDGLVLLFEKTGYAPVTKSLGDSIVYQDGGSETACGCTITPDGLSWNQPMYLVSTTGATITGRVLNGTKPVMGATVTLVSEDNLAPTTTDVNGFFTFTGVKQLSGLSLIVSDKGFTTYNGASFTIGATSFGYLPNGTVASPFYDAGDIVLNPLYSLQGIVTDGASLKPLAGVTVTLNTPDDLPPVVTDANGNYQFFVTLETVSNTTTPWSITFSAPGYATDVQTISFTGSTTTTTTTPIPTDVACEIITTTAGVTQPTCIDNHAMTRSAGEIAGTVRFAGNPVTGAVVQLCINPSASASTAQSYCPSGTTTIGGTTVPNLAGQTTTTANGTFSFNGLILAAWYSIIVFPVDTNGDGITDTQITSTACGPVGSSSPTCNGGLTTTDADLTNLAITLQAPGKFIIASSFSSTPTYPWGVTDMGATGNGYTVPVAGMTNAYSFTAGFLATPTTPIFLQFGAPVDPSVTTFELHQVVGPVAQPGAGISPPLPITVTWSGGTAAATDAGVAANNPSVIATIVPGSPLVPFNTSTNITYSLWITSFRWADGTVAITQSPVDVQGATNEELNFSVYGLPTLLANPTPSVYLGNQTFLDTSTNTVRKATQAVFDFDAVYYLDLNNDVLTALTATAKGTNDSTTVGSLDLTWQAIPGAAKYEIYARNTTAAVGPNPPTGSSDWVQLVADTTSITGPVAPSGNPTVVATGVNPWNWSVLPQPTALQGDPWAFGNQVQFAIVSVDQNGNVSPIDPTKLLTTGDKWGGEVASAVPNDTSQPGEFGSVVELGDLFNQTISVTYTEQMLGNLLPTLALGNAIPGGPLTLLKTNAVAFGNGAGGVATTAPNASNEAFFNVQFQDTSLPCTEITATASTGNTLLEVRDSTLFASGSPLLVLGSGAAGADPAGVPVAQATVGSVSGTGTPNVVPIATPGLAAYGPVPTPPVEPNAVNALAHDYACSLTTGAPNHGLASAGSGTVSTWCNTPGSNINCVIAVSNGAASAFSIGESVEIYDPAVAGGFPNAAYGSTVKITGVDTAGNRLAVGGGDATSFTATIAGTVLTVTVEPTAGTIAVGQALTGSGVNGTIIVGGTDPNYVLSTSSTVGTAVVMTSAGFSTGSGASFTGSITGTVLSASAVTGTLAPGMVLGNAATVTPFLANNTIITGQTSGTTGGAGTYTVNSSQTFASSPMVAAFGTAGQTGTSVVIPLAGSGEVALRTVTELSSTNTGSIGLAGDVAPPAGTSVVIPFGISGAGGAQSVPIKLPGTFPVVVGDMLLLDNDGDLTTTPDQTQAQVTAVDCFPNTAAVTVLQNTICNVTATVPTPVAPQVAVALTQGSSRVFALGDTFKVTGQEDTSKNTPLNPHGDQFSFTAGATFTSAAISTTAGLTTFNVTGLTAGQTVFPGAAVIGTGGPAAVILPWGTGGTTGFGGLGTYALSAAATGTPTGTSTGTLPY